MSTMVRFIGLPRHVAVSVKEITEADGQRVTLVVFGSEPDSAPKKIRDYEALAERVIRATAPINRPPEPELSEAQKREVREEIRLWWNRKLLSLFPAPPWNEERRQFVLGYWPTLGLGSSEDDLKAASDEIAALAAHSRLAALMRGETSNRPPASPYP